MLGLDRKKYLAVLALMVWGIAMIAISSPDNVSLWLEASRRRGSRSHARRCRSRSVTTFAFALIAHGLYHRLAY